LRGRDGYRADARSSSGAIAVCILAALIAAGVAGLIATAGHESLPILLADGRYTPTMIVVVTSVWSLSFVALLVLFFRKPQTLLDLWLMVVMCVWIFDIGMSAVLNAGRFDLGFYLGRIYGLVAASIVLVVLLFEAGALQVQLARLIDAARRRVDAERDRSAEQERLFAATVESSIDAVVIKSLDGTILAWNESAEKLFGYPAEEAIGQNIDIIVPPERRAEVREILGQVGRGSRVRHYETVRRAKDGREIPVSLSVSPVMSATGQIIGASKIARDITETKRTQSALNQGIEERRRVFETSLDLIFVTDPKGTFVQVSPSSLPILGYLPEEMVGHSATGFIDPADLESTRNEMRSARRGGEMRNFVTS